ncbi:MFS transporter [Actinomadura fulvescens]|uniref:MFS transporter n=1 Tax=Actinomadura fulvescens TaxID=46160 RepID=UPI0031D9BA62
MTTTLSGTPNDRPRPARSPWRALVGGSIGNLVEWYDWFVYSSFAVYFASAFFPKGNSTAQLLNTMGIFAVGFFMRPVGGWLLGRLGDRKGRKAALTATVTLMSASALLIAVAPTYAQVGYFGAAVLLVARLLQGLSVGGEYAASATYLTETSAPGKPTWPWGWATARRTRTRSWVSARSRRRSRSRRWRASTSTTPISSWPRSPTWCGPGGRSRRRAASARPRAVGRRRRAARSPARSRA